MFNSQESATIWHASRQPGVQNFAPHAFNHFSTANSQHGSISRDTPSPVNSFSRQVSMSMLDGDAHLGHTLFAHLTQNHRHTSLEDVKREFYPFLLHTVQHLAGLDPIGAQHLLQVIFEHSDVSEVLLMRCFDQALQ